MDKVADVGGGHGAASLGRSGHTVRTKLLQDWSVNKTKKAVGGTDLEDQVGEEQRSGW